MDQLEEIDNVNFSQKLSKSARVEENYTKTINFMGYLKNDVVDKKNEEECVWKYLDNFYEFGIDGKIDKGKNPLEIFFTNKKFEAVNTVKLPDLNLYNSEGSIVLIEFFTHCCINCIHSIEDVRQVYEEIIMQTNEKKTGLKIVSIHSPKFTREKDSESIKAFTEQLKMDYSDVVNDPESLLWNSLGISCWPTLLILGPNPTGNNGMNLLFTMMGEGHKHVLKFILSSALSYFHAKLRKGDEIDGTKDPFDKVKRTITSESSISNKSILRYPGKVACSNDLLAIADTGNHRILISDVNGSIKHIVGSGKKGLADGDFTEAKFNLPQGIVFNQHKEESILYVADTGNHSIRMVHLSLGKVSTLIHPEWNYTTDNRETIHLRSPWDVAFFSKEILLVAAAGNHRIFAYFFESSKFLMSEFSKDTFVVIAGNGKEENRNNSYILKSSFAQPSGICVTNTSQNSATIYIADSESSSIRSISTEGKGKVNAVVGGARDPTDLFSYGDVDGKGVNAKLQHPMGVCCFSQEDTKSSKVYFVDTYNNKVKVIDVDSQSCSKLFCGNKECEIEVQFNEPGGICISLDGKTLYVADTNNHSIKSINLDSNSVENIVFKLPSSDFKIQSQNLLVYDNTFTIDTNSGDNNPIKIIITNIPENFEGGQWYLTKLLPDDDKVISKGEFIRDADSGNAEILIEFSKRKPEQQYSLMANIFLCGPSSCYKRTLKFLLKLISSSKDQKTDTVIYFKHEPNANFFI